MTFKLGLTGSIGMGKSTTAAMFAKAGCRVWDADAAVHRLYAQKGAAVEPLRLLFPEAIINSEVSRTHLKNIIANDPDALRKIEAIVHPLVAADRASFLAENAGHICVFDIPLLFETGGDAHMDAVACVTVPADIQMTRVLERGTMTKAQFQQILSKQMPNDEKCARADYVIVTDTLDHVQRQVQTILAEIKGN